MKKNVTFFCLILFTVAAFAKPSLKPFYFQKKEDLPLTAINVAFRTGSADDPQEKAGLAFLTAQLLRQGGVKTWGGLPARNRAGLEEFLYPLAAEIEVTVAKEQTAVRALVPVRDAEIVFQTIAQMILAPAWDFSEFQRIQKETEDALQNQWPREDQEELGKAVLNAVLYPNHPYAHVVEGKIHSVKSVSLDEIQAFHKNFYSQKRVSIGVAGSISKALEEKVKAFYAALPEGKTTQAQLPVPEKIQDSQLWVVEAPFEATGIHIGFPLSINRSSVDFPGLLLATQAFGKHRSFVGRLMRQVRQVRGLNYGTFAYIEDFPNGGQLLSEPTQVARSQQAMTIWARPTRVENGCFLLRQLLREMESLVKNGLTEKEFESGKSHLMGTAPLLSAGLDRALGYLLDNVFYRARLDYPTSLQASVRSLTRKKVNDLIKQHLRFDRLQIAVITPQAEAFEKAISQDQCPIQYASGIQKEVSVMKEDAAIARFPITVKKENIRRFDVKKLFE